MQQILRNIIVFCFLAGTFPSLASILYSSNIEKAHRELLNLDYLKTDYYLNLESKKNPKNLYINYFQTYQFFLKAYFEPNKNSFDKFIEQSNKSLKRLEDDTDKETALLLSATISIQQAFIFFLWGEHLSYVRALMQGQSLLDDINPQTKNLEYLKIKSIYEVLGGSVPDKFKALASWFNIKGSAKKGIQLIEEYLKKSPEHSSRKNEGEIIALYLKSFLDIPVQNTQPKTPILLRYVYLQSSNELATQKISLINELNSESINYFLFLKAQFLIELQKEEGFQLMNRFIKEQTNKSFLHAAHYYLAWYFCAKGNKEAYRNEISKIKRLPSPIFPADKKALQRTEQTCNLYLVKSRMLFDAGEYKEAYNVLIQKKVIRSLIALDEKIEYLYRLARIYENLGHTTKAIDFYQKVIDTQRSKLYFVSFSAYRIGKIYSILKQNKKALDYFNTALNLNDGEYKKSIEQKCQFAISLLEN